MFIPKRLNGCLSVCLPACLFGRSVGRSFARSLGLFGLLRPEWLSGQVVGSGDALNFAGYTLRYFDKPCLAEPIGGEAGVENTGRQSD